MVELCQIMTFVGNNSIKLKFGLDHPSGLHITPKKTSHDACLEELCFQAFFKMLHVKNSDLFYLKDIIYHFLAFYVDNFLL